MCLKFLGLNILFAFKLHKLHFKSKMYKILQWYAFYKWTIATFLDIFNLSSSVALDSCEVLAYLTKHGLFFQESFICLLISFHLTSMPKIFRPTYYKL